jgi:nucleoside-diphosphate-sugar epimerase
MSMLNWIKRGLPLPLGAVNNARSLVALENLVDFIFLCADRTRASRATNEIFLISDGEDVSTTELLRKAAKAFRQRLYLIPVPSKLLRLAAWMSGKSLVADRLLGSLCVDSSKGRSLLGWRPIVTMDEQLRRMADYAADV